MKDIPFEVAKEFCEEFEKDQCVILSWDAKSNNTWVTTYGVGDENSIQATNSGIFLKNTLGLERVTDGIPKRFEDWKIERVDRYYYGSGRNHWTYNEVTYWYESHSTMRKETTRSVTIVTGGEWNLPEWAKGITERRKVLESNYY